MYHIHILRAYLKNVYFQIVIAWFGGGLADFCCIMLSSTGKKEPSMTICNVILAGGRGAGRRCK